MPKAVDAVVDEINDILRMSGGAVITFLWPDFYALCGIQRWKTQRGDEIAEKARSKYGLVVGYGSTVVVIAHDRNFAPASV